MAERPQNKKTGIESGMRSRRPWSELDDQIVVRHELDDAQLASIIERTVPAIRMRRMMLKRGAHATMKHAAWRARNKDKIKTNQDRWRARNPDKIRTRARQYYADSSPPPGDRRGHYRSWMPDEDAALLAFTGPLRVLSKQLGRTYAALVQRRRVLRQAQRPEAEG